MHEEPSGQKAGTDVEGQLRPSRVERTRDAPSVVSRPRSLLHVRFVLKPSLSPGCLGRGLCLPELSSRHSLSPPTDLDRPRLTSSGVCVWGGSPRWESRFPTLGQRPVPTSAREATSSLFPFPTSFSSIPFTSTNILYVLLITFI